MLLKEEQIFNYLNGQSTSQESGELEQWIAESEKNKREFEKIKKIYDLSNVDEKAYIPDVEAGWSKVSDHLFSAKEIKMPVETESKGVDWNMAIRIAAMLVMAVGISFYLFNKDSSQTYALAYNTTSDEVKELVLSDGTIVSLNNNSKFKYYDELESNVRKVYLDGEAFFEVAKDAERPFIIYSQNATTKVLGTSFNLSTNSEGAEVDVFSGRVAFGNLTQQNNNVVLVKGERASFENGKISKLVGFDPNVLAWKTGDLKFEGAPISDVVETLEKIYKSEIKYDQNIANCLITSTFENQTLDEVLEVIEIIAQIENSHADNIIKLSGPGCQ